MKPKVSVVICFYNGAAFMREALASVLKQTFTEWELVLVDDGSTDESTAIARNFADADRRVRYVTHPGHGNRGLAESRVLGSDAACGEYLLFLDHDDVLHPDGLERLAGVLDAHPQAAAVFAATCFWESPATGESKKHIQTFAPLSSGMIRGRHFLRRLIMSDAHHPTVCSTMFRRPAFNAARDRAPVWPDIYEDTALLLKLTAAHDIYLLDAPVSDYRVHGASMSYMMPRDFGGFLRWAACEIPMDAVSRAVLHARRMMFELGRTVQAVKATVGRVLRRPQRPARSD